MTQLIALDLFAGTGWGVACQRLGIRESGVEIMPEAVASRAAAGMTTVYNDVWDGLADPSILPAHNLLIASPPCQTFSVAGKGAGRKALDDVLALIPFAADPAVHIRAVAAERGLDDRTALVLSPLAYVVRFLPTFVTLEQVPTVLPVWQAIAPELERLGYSVVTGVLNAEQYGVPQTRKRAILIARRDGKDAALPTPTHSRYYSRDPQRLDPDVKPWVSMSEALGWGFTSRPMTTLSNACLRGNAVSGTGSRDALAKALADGSYITPTELVSNYGTGGDATKRGLRAISAPAPTITSKANRNKWDGVRNLTESEAAVLQSYPEDFPFHGAKSDRALQIGNAVPPLLAQAILATFLD